MLSSIDSFPQFSQRGAPMPRLLFTTALAGVLGWIMNASIGPLARAADLNSRVSSAEGFGSCHRVWRCSTIGCGWQRVCASPCPDGYSCYSLYGAYGPYGGAAYWSAYTPSGWDYVR